MGKKLRLKVADRKKVDPIFLETLKNHKDIITSFLSGEVENFKKINTTSEKIKAYDRKVYERIPLSYSQERLWFLDKMRGTIQYHIPTVLRFEGNLNEGYLEQSLREIINRHEVLRTVFKEKEGEGLPFQMILEKDIWSLSYVEKIGATFEELQEELILPEIDHPFDLANDHPLRGLLIKTGGQEYILVLVNASHCSRWLVFICTGKRIYGIVPLSSGES